MRGATTCHLWARMHLQTFSATAATASLDNCRTNTVIAGCCTRSDSWLVGKSLILNHTCTLAPCELFSSDDAIREAEREIK